MKRPLLVPVFLAAACGAFAQAVVPSRPAPPRAEGSASAEAPARSQRIVQPARVRAAEVQAETAKLKCRLIVEEYTFAKDALAADLVTVSDPRSLLQAAVKGNEATVAVRAGTSVEGAFILIKQSRMVPVPQGTNQISFRDLGVTINAAVSSEGIATIKYHSDELGAAVKVGNDSIPAISRIDLEAQLPLEFGKSALLGVVPPDEAITKSRAVIVRLEKVD